MSTPTYDGAPSDHFDGELFFNPGVDLDKNLADGVRIGLQYRRAEWERRDDIARYDEPIPERVHDGLHVTFVNHATVLIQTGGVNILTDPVWSDRVSPFPWAGPRRFRPPGIAFDELPPVDAVLLSHNHYDHFDAETLKRLTAEHDPLFLVPLNNAPLLRSLGIERIEEHDWWDEGEVAGLRLVCTPAQHWSSRTFGDRRRALWSGWWIETPAGAVYFAGDTGFGPFYQQVRDRLGRPRVALLPIGAYEPRWFMKESHQNPAEAVKAHTVLEPERSIGIHFGTWKLTFEAMDDPPRDLEKAKTQWDVPADAFVAPRNGERFRLD